jgi:gliding motility-associated-like protein
VVKSFRFEAYRVDTGATLPTFSFNPPQTSVVMAYTVTNGQVVQGAPSPAPAAPLFDAARAQDMLSLFWHNGNEWVKLGGVVDDQNHTVTLKSGRLGRYQLRQALRIGPASLTRVYPRIFSPNGDGWNDKVSFEFDNPAQVALKGVILDASGAKIADMVPGANPETSLVWDGKKGGTAVPAGIYIYQIQVGNESATGTVVVAK